jgi:methylglutaconyl-CoA hydratase
LSAHRAAPGAHVVPQADLRLEGARIVDLSLSNGPDAISETKAWTLCLAWSDLSEQDFISLVESHSAKRQSAEAQEGLASFAEKRAAKWPTKG